MYSERARIALLIAAVGLSVWPALARAQSGNAAPFNPAYCNMPELFVVETEAVSLREAADTPATATADEVELLRDSGDYLLRGDAVLERADQRLAADRILFNQEDYRAEAEGDLRYSESGLLIQAESAQLSMRENRGFLSAASFRFENSYAHGEAERIHLDSASLSRYQGVRFSTCPGGSEDWWLKASRLYVDRNDGLAVAHHARMHFLGVPIFYVPYISFPIDSRRRSGFLTPSFRQSDRAGLDVRIPWYWDIAPNYDAVLALRSISRHGDMLDTEWRLLRPSFSAESDLEYLPGDRQTGEDRWLTALHARDRVTAPYSWQLELNRVSDDEYLRDFGDDLEDIGTSHLRSQADFHYQVLSWGVDTQLQTWQTIDPTIAPVSHPYRILPRVQVTHRPDRLFGVVSYKLDSELVNFAHPHPAARDTGRRLDLMPSFSLPRERLGYFVTPTLAVRHTAYSLNPGGNTAIERASRTVPIASIDSGIFLERSATVRGRPLLQTLEPRIFYLYVPYRDQDDLPLFDTQIADLTLAQLFRTNRYTGRDRIGDANQIATSLTTRLTDRQSGEQYLSAAIGQIYYLDDRKVRLATEPAEELQRGTSDVMSEVRVRLTRGLTGFAEHQWDPYDERTEKSGLQLRYQPAPDTVVNLGYRMRADSGTTPGTRLEQADFSFAVPLGYRWHVMTGARYSLTERTSLQHFAGLKFNNCCWSLSVLGREYASEGQQSMEREIMLQLEFTGLGDVGHEVRDFVIDSVPGYRPQR